LLFPPEGEDPFGFETKKFDAKSLTLKDFQELMSKEYLNYTLVRSNEIRQRFTEFVFRNRIQALNEQSQSILNSESYLGMETSKRTNRHKDTSFDEYMAKGKTNKSKREPLNDSSRMNSTGRPVSKRQSII
jgi:hypothetical protein